MSRPRLLPFVAAIVLGLLALLVPSTALAAEIRSGNNVVVGPTETIDDDLYAFGQSVTIRGTVNGSVVATGNSVTIAGVVNGDVLAAAGTVDVPGDVRGSIRAAGGTVTLSGSTARDLLAAGGAINVARDGRIGRDVLLAGGSATMAGPVGRDVWASAGNVELSAPVGRNVQAQVDALRLADGAAIRGDLRYVSPQDATVAPGAVVSGAVTHSLPTAAIAPAQPTGIALAGAAVLGWLRALVGLAVLGIGLVLLFPGFAARTSDALGASPWASLGLGFAELVGGPILAILVLIVGAFVGGWWLGLGLFALYVAALVVGYVVAGFYVGRWTLARAAQGGRHPIWAALLGLVLLTLVGAVPFVGGWITALALVFGVGALTIALARTYRQGRGVAAPPAGAVPTQPVELRPAV